MGILLYISALYVGVICAAAIVILLREVIPDMYRDYKEKKRAKNTPNSPCNPRSIGYK